MFFATYSRTMFDILCSLCVSSIKIWKLPFPNCNNLSFITTDDEFVILNLITRKILFHGDEIYFDNMGVLVYSRKCLHGPDRIPYFI